MIFDLPTALEFGGRAWDIETDYRQVLRILTAYEDPDLTDGEKAMLCLYNLYVDFDDIPPGQLQAAYDAATAFIDHGNGDDQTGPRTMDWTQDAPLIFPAVNAVAGCEVRAKKYLHWWTFCGYFMEIRDSTASTVFALRQKKAKGKKLEKWEKEYWRENATLCKLHTRLTDEEQAEQDAIEKLLGG
jgi:hypothetical protein